MLRIVIAYGDYEGYLLGEVPAELLDDLEKRFPLDPDHHDDSDHTVLLVTVAIHWEIKRRAAGGKARRHVPSVKELASQVVNRGFRQLSKEHHPDRTGEKEAQTRLGEAKEQLLRFCSRIKEEFDQDVILVPPPGTSPRRSSIGITDDDIPF